MSTHSQTVADKIMREISKNEHFVDELRSNPDDALSSIGINDPRAKKALNDVDWDAPDVGEQLKERTSKIVLF